MLYLLLFVPLIAMDTQSLSPNFQRTIIELQKLYARDLTPTLVEAQTIQNPKERQDFKQEQQRSWMAQNSEAISSLVKRSRLTDLEQHIFLQRVSTTLMRGYTARLRESTTLVTLTQEQQEFCTSIRTSVEPGIALLTPLFERITTNLDLPWTDVHDLLADVENAIQEALQPFDTEKERFAENVTAEGWTVAEQDKCSLEFAESYTRITEMVQLLMHHFNPLERAFMKAMRDKPTTTSRPRPTQRQIPAPPPREIPAPQSRISEPRPASTRQPNTNIRNNPPPGNGATGLTIGTVIAALLLLY